MALASYMRVPAALLMAILVSGLSPSAVGSVSADRWAEGRAHPSHVHRPRASYSQRPWSMTVRAQWCSPCTPGAWSPTHRGYPPTGRSARVILHRLPVDAPVIFTTPIVDPLSGTIVVAVHPYQRAIPWRAPSSWWTVHAAPSCTALPWTPCSWSRTACKAVSS